ncbi:MAG: hypothetical protein HY216_13510 [Candidatus Rokubacteria bacterium]|nr:hypothetical protein [Candidatus Rokubacteria bacterium]
MNIAGLTGGAHLFEVKARDLAGNEDPTPAQHPFTVNALRVTITNPADGGVVTAGVTIVRGTVLAGGGEVGVTVNGIPAAVDGMTFAAAVPISPETLTLTAVATIIGGATASHTVGIAATPPAAGQPVLIATPASGAAPLAVAFSVVNTPPTTVSLDADGDGRPDVSGSSSDTLSFSFVRPGTYVATATIAGGSGSLTADTLVQVFDRATFDAMLSGKWTAMKNALRGGNVTAALDYIALSARDDYRAMFSALTPRFPQIDQVLTDIFLVSFEDGRAEYQMIRIQDGIRLSYFVLFVRDADGLWRLKFF